MGHLTLRIFVLFTLAIAPCLAEQNFCGAKFGHVNEACLCGDSLGNLTVATPRGMALEAVCGLAEMNLGVPRPIDLTSEKISLDTFTQDGGYYWGTFIFTGTIEVTGVLDFAPSDSGIWWFVPDASLRPYQSIFADIYSALLLDKELPRDPPGLPSDLVPQAGFYNCLRTPMKISFDRLDVEISNREGAYVHGLKLMAPFKYEKTAC